MDVASGRGGYADLAIGSPADPAGGQDLTGAVTVLYGSARGLTTVGATRLARPPSRSATGTTGGFVGAALAAATSTATAWPTRAVGAVFEDPRPENIDYGWGAVHLLFGGPSGLSAAGQRTIARPNPADATFGQVLTLGDSDRDGHVDLVEGAPGKGDAFEGRGIPGHTSYCPRRPERSEEAGPRRGPLGSGSVPAGDDGEADAAQQPAPTARALPSTPVTDP